MKLSADGKALIHHFEQCRLTAYKDGDHYSIGWGHNGPDVKKGMKITQQRADELFEKDIGWAEDAVERLVTIELAQHEFDALVSFVYNFGEPKFKGSNLLRRLNLGERLPVADHFVKWVYFEGEISPGLVKRRGAERAFFKGLDLDSALKAGEEWYAANEQRLQGS